MRKLARLAEISSHSRVSELESGKRLLTAEELGRILDILDVSPDKREELLGAARTAEGPGQLNIGLPGVDRTLARLIEYEQAAVRIIAAAPLLIPGLLQTSDYARAIMGEQPDSELRVNLRISRRDILTRTSHPVELLALIDSEALLRPVASQAVMLDQMKHILELAARPNIMVQIVPSAARGYHPMLGGAFELIQFSMATPVVLLDSQRNSAFVWDTEQVRAYIEDAERIRSEVAMTPARSAEVIESIVKGTETT